MAQRTEATAAPEAPRRKPRLALALATVCGVGYLPKAPGTFGSLVGIVVAILTHPVSLIVVVWVIFLRGMGLDIHIHVPMVLGHKSPVFFLIPAIVALVVVGLLGVWSSSRAAAYAGLKDPQYVVIDEVSGMHLTLLLAMTPVQLSPRLLGSGDAAVYGQYAAFSLLNWKYLLLAFVLFRLFDIWKPFPIRRLEKLPGGWGIMADDWLAGIYAAILLRLALHFSLL